jgi:hypothetical protein
MCLAPADPAVAVAGLDQDRREGLEGAVGEAIRRDQRQLDPIQRDLGQRHSAAPGEAGFSGENSHGKRSR